VIILYELYWSHYCEKIRWALDYKKLPWKKVGINAFTKTAATSAKNAQVEDAMFILQKR
jgi:glutathione S-transferase